MEWNEDATLRANREGSNRHVQLRPRRLHDATKVDMRVELFGTVYNSPIFLCPVSGHKAFSAGGELAVARAAKARGTLQFLSLATSTAVEDVNKELDRPVWQQFYAPASWDACEKILRRVETAGRSDRAYRGQQHRTQQRNIPAHAAKNTSQCTSCHESADGPTPHERPMYDGVNMAGLGFTDLSMDWAFVDRLRKFWKGKITQGDGHA